jgi:hypothetical protein
MLVWNLGDYWFLFGVYLSVIRIWILHSNLDCECLRMIVIRKNLYPCWATTQFAKSSKPPPFSTGLLKPPAHLARRPTEPAGPSITYPSPCPAAKWGPHVSPLPCFLFPFLSLPVTALWGQGAAPPWPLPHCACTAGCPPRGWGTDAKVRPPSIHFPGTLAPPYKSNPQPHLPVPRYLSVRKVVPTLTSNKRQGLSLNGRC